MSKLRHKEVKQFVQLHTINKQSWGSRPNLALHLFFFFLNKVLLKHSLSLCLHILYGCFCTIPTELSSCDKDPVTHKA